MVMKRNPNINKFLAGDSINENETNKNNTTTDKVKTTKFMLDIPTDVHFNVKKGVLSYGEKITMNEYMVEAIKAFNKKYVSL